MNNKEIAIEKRNNDDGAKNEIKQAQRSEIVIDLQEEHVKDCKDNCMHCGFHCKYLKDDD